MTDESASKDLFFARLGHLAEEMIAAHGKDFAMGTLVLAARFIAEGKSLAQTVVPVAADPAAKPARPDAP